MNTRQVMPDKEYFKLLQKDSMMLFCIDALGILTLKQWQDVQAMYEEETKTLAEE